MTCCKEYNGYISKYKELSETIYQEGEYYYSLTVDCNEEVIHISAPEASITIELNYCPWCGTKLTK